MILFTASEQEYADPIVNLLDPHNEIFTARFYRTSCFHCEFGYIKDLRIF